MILRKIIIIDKKLVIKMSALKLKRLISKFCYMARCIWLDTGSRIPRDGLVVTSLWDFWFPFVHNVKWNCSIWLIPCLLCCQYDKWCLCIERRINVLSIYLSIYMRILMTYIVSSWLNAEINYSENDRLPKSNEVFDNFILSYALV